MIRCLVAGLAVAPPVFTLTIMACALMLKGGSLSGGPMSPSGPVGVVIYALIGSYMFGWLPGLVVGGLNGLVRRLVRQQRLRLLLAAGNGLVTMGAVSVVVGGTNRAEAWLVMLAFAAAALASLLAGVAGGMLAPYSAAMLGTTSSSER